MYCNVQKNLLHTQSPSHNNNFQAFRMFFRDIVTATPTNVYFRPLLKWRRLFHRRATLYWLFSIDVSDLRHIVPRGIRRQMTFCLTLVGACSGPSAESTRRLHGLLDLRDSVLLLAGRHGCHSALVPVPLGDRCRRPRYGRGEVA